MCKWSGGPKFDYADNCKNRGGGCNSNKIRKPGCWAGLYTIM